jgi:hypothetical protein
VHAWNPSTQEAEAEGSWVPGQPGYIVRACLKKKRKSLCNWWIPMLIKVTNDGIIYLKHKPDFQVLLQHKHKLLSNRIFILRNASLDDFVVRWTCSILTQAKAVMSLGKVLVIYVIHYWSEHCYVTHDYLYIFKRIFIWKINNILHVNWENLWTPSQRVG